VQENACRVGLGAKEWRWPTSEPHSKEFPDLNKAPNQILGGGGANSQEERKNPGKNMEVGNPISNTFNYCNFFQISTYFELFKRFQVKTGLTDLCSLRLIACLIAITPELLFG
jgi:hypothetical protein